MKDIQWAQWAAAIATFLAVLVALRLNWRVFPPKLRLSLVSENGQREKLPLGKIEDGATVITSVRDALYYRMQLTNERSWSVATDAGVYLVSVDNENAAGEYSQIWAGAVPVVATHYGVHPGRTLGASPQEYDLCSVVRDKWLELHPAVRGVNDAAFKYRPEESHPIRIRATFQARSLEAVSPPVRFEMAWDGEWSDDTIEMRRHVIVRAL